MREHLRKWKYRIALVVVALLLAVFLVRTFDAYRALMEKTMYGKANIHSIRGWMNVDRVSRLYNADPACICGQFNLSVADCHVKAMWQLNAGGQKRLPPGDRQKFEMMTPVYEKVTSCMGEAPKPDDWMRIGYMSGLYSADAGCICGKMDIPADKCQNTTVNDIIMKRGPAQAPNSVLDEIWNVIQDCPKNSGGQ